LLTNLILQLKLRGYGIINGYILLFLMICPLSSLAITEQPPKIGNFALPASQQPGPLVCFGQNIISRNQTLLFLFADDYAGESKHLVDIIPSVLYGVTDNLSLFINAPYAASYKIEHQKSNGFEDAFAQLEYAFYNSSSNAFVDQATVVFNVTAPTGAKHKNPPTGEGSPSFFIGTTFNRSCVDWLVFASPGVVVTTTKSGTKFGNSYLYQFGFGRNIADTHGWILAWITEVNGTYTQKNKINGAIDPNSGGNVVYLTPSFWASTKKLILQLGVGYAVTQHLFGNQNKNTYLITGNIGWNFK
jgi:hypothetical protein